MRHPYAVAALTALLAVGAVATAVYYSHYTWKHGADALTPLEAWLVARKHRDALDRELAKITDTDKR